MAVTKRIFQLAKEFERDEKEIIAFLTAQGIKVGNRLSAVSEETYNMLKAKFTAPPEPEPEPPKPEPKPVEQPKAPAPTEQPQPEGGGKKKKKKNKQPQPAEAAESVAQEEQPVKEVSDAKIENMNKRTQTTLYEGIVAGNEFINHYSTAPEQPAFTASGKKKVRVPRLFANTDSWALLFNHKFEYPDATPARYWNSVAKFMTRAFKALNGFGLSHKEELAKMREALFPLGLKYQPREIFSDEENQKFEEQQLLLFRTFGHGMGLVNDNLFELKLKAERMKVKYERMNFLEYVTNPQDELRSNDRVPFEDLVDAVMYSLRGVVRRYDFYFRNEERINNVIKKFSEWLDGYAKLKEQGASAAKLEKYLELEEKFIELVEFMSFDNLLSYSKNKPQPFDTILEHLEAYRDNLDDPDAERDFKYKVRGVTNIIFKPKEYVFTYHFAGLEPNKDYRTPEMIAEYEAKKAAEAAQKENPAD